MFQKDKTPCLLCPKLFFYCSLANPLTVGLWTCRIKPCDPRMKKSQPRAPVSSSRDISSMLERPKPDTSCTGISTKDTSKKLTVVYFLEKNCRNFPLSARRGRTVNCSSLLLSVFACLGTLLWPRGPLQQLSLITAGFGNTLSCCVLSTAAGSRGGEKASGNGCVLILDGVGEQTDGSSGAVGLGRAPLGTLALIVWGGRRLFWL